MSPHARRQLQREALRLFAELESRVQGRVRRAASAEFLERVVAPLIDLREATGGRWLRLDPPGTPPGVTPNRR